MSFRAVYRLAPPYIRGLLSYEMLCGVGGKVEAEVSGMITDPFFRAKDCLALENDRHAVSICR